MDLCRHGNLDCAQCHEDQVTEQAMRRAAAPVTHESAGPPCEWCGSDLRKTGKSDGTCSRCGGEQIAWLNDPHARYVVAMQMRAEGGTR